MRVTIRLVKNEPGDAWQYTASCVEIPGAISEGATKDEAVKNVLAALEDIIALRRKTARAEVRKSKARNRPALRAVFI